MCRDEWETESAIFAPLIPSSPHDRAILRCASVGAEKEAQMGGWKSRRSYLVLRAREEGEEKGISQGSLGACVLNPTPKIDHFANGIRIKKKK